MVYYLKLRISTLAKKVETNKDRLVNWAFFPFPLWIDKGKPFKYLHRLFPHCICFTDLTRYFQCNPMKEQFIGSFNLIFVRVYLSAQSWLSALDIVVVCELGRYAWHSIMTLWFWQLCQLLASIITNQDHMLLCPVMMSDRYKHCYIIRNLLWT